MHPASSPPPGNPGLKGVVLAAVIGSVMVLAATATDTLWLVLLIAAAGCAVAWTGVALLLRGMGGERTA
ncbi:MULTISPECIES: hypothetical protein [unclassified Streptomyces]|uniref:hypothetical protein n=1 Tax=Streptomyces TaxID=1883 RepID=UPI000FDA1D90|nr:MULTISPECIES: hypothetical protein [unclassified Streptomyces]UQA38375.1 hypothetical protein KRR37_21495 [Streptomyces sp. HNA39]